MSISKLNFEVMFYTHRSLSDPRTVNFISVLPLIQKEPGNGQDIIGKMSMPDFQIIYPNFAFKISLEMKLLWLNKLCSIGLNLVPMDRGHIGLHYDRRDRKVNDQFLSYSSHCSMVDYAWRADWFRDSSEMELCFAISFLGWTGYHNIEYCWIA
ncbi:hypothetical protein F2Q70_00030336 [Brassica cretica]|uniref:Uncharacterized protein n=1 Tax=Brassica cretica TaxID=69181 RepID=A0A8S9FB39_BRACR|nr:hypothetical protein F2Q70_00030336 [Brassica cretica]